MKGLYFTDIHFGRRNNSKEHNQDCYDFVVWAIIQATIQKVDYIAFLGDWFECRNAVDISTLNIAYQAAVELSKIGIPIYFCIGNHDLYKRFSREQFSTVHYKDIPNFVIVDEPQIHNDVLFCPFLFEEEYDSLVKYSDTPIWAGHFEFSGFSITSFNTMKEGGPTHSMFKDVGLILSGHFHKRQRQDNTLYIGNCFPLDFSDVHDNDRGICILEHDDLSTTFTAWNDQPTFHRIPLSILKDNFPSNCSKTRIKSLIDIDITPEELLSIKKDILSKGCREIVFEEHKLDLQEYFKLDDDEVIDTDNFSSLRQLIDLMIDKIDTDEIDKTLLKQILDKTGEFESFGGTSETLEFYELSMQNFYSYGNSPTTINLSELGLFNLLSGENQDVVYDDNDKCKSGSGKAQPLDAKIKIPGGWTTMGEVEPGNIITGSTGLPITVIDTFPQGMKKIYKITFYDGRTTEACEDHLWEIHTRFKQKNGKLTTLIMSTAQIIQWLSEARPDRNHAMHISLVEHENIQDIALPMDPYLLGALLGDGSLTSTIIKFTNIDEHIIKRVSDIALREYGTEMISYDKGDKKDFVFVGGNGVSRIVGEHTGKGKNQAKRSAIGYSIEQMGLRGCNSYTKFVPEIYKHSSYNQKMQLLQGLLDTDGTVGKGGDLSFSTSSLTLANDVVYLVRSLGGTATLSSRYPTYTYKGEKLKGQLSYYIGIRHSNRRDMVSVPRKLERLSETYQYADLKLRIKNVEYVGEKEAKCILVDDPSHLYVTDNFVVTHNTSLLNCISYCCYDRVIKDDVTFDDMINTFNKVNMKCTLKFGKGSNIYHITRRRKAGKNKSTNDVTIHLIDANGDLIKDLTKDSSANTNKFIKELIGLQFETFTRMVLFTATNTPFFSLPVTSSTNLSQTDILEDLFRLKELTTKAENIKKYQKTLRDKLAIEAKTVEMLERNNNQKKASQQNLINNKEQWDIKNETEIKNIGMLLSNIPDNIEQILEDSTKFQNARMNVLEIHRTIEHVDNNIAQTQKSLSSHIKEVESLSNSKCPYCKQAHFDNDKLSKLTIMVKNEQSTIEELTLAQNQCLDDFEGLAATEAKYAYTEQYKNAVKWFSEKQVLESKLDQLKTQSNPFTIALESLDSTMDIIDYTIVDNIKKELTHCDFLVKILIKKDSFVRKALLKQNLPFLNTKLNEYLAELKLPHLVYFTDELLTSIELKGRPISFSTISNGQIARVNIALCLAFRDVITRMHSPINLLMLDECLDTGLSNNGVMNAARMIRNKAQKENIKMLIVTHRDEIASMQFDKHIKVVYANNFSTAEVLK